MAQFTFGGHTAPTDGETATGKATATGATAPASEAAPPWFLATRATASEVAPPWLLSSCVCNCSQRDHHGLRLTHAYPEAVQQTLLQLTSSGHTPGAGGGSPLSDRKEPCIVLFGVEWPHQTNAAQIAGSAPAATPRRQRQAAAAPGGEGSSSRTSL